MGFLLELLFDTPRPNRDLQGPWRRPPIPRGGTQSFPPLYRSVTIARSFDLKLGIGAAAALALALLGACSPQGGSGSRPSSSASQSARANAASAPLAARVAAINNAQFSAPPQAGSTQPDPVLVKAEVLLARAGASPGEIDGLAGSNLKRAVAAYEQMNALPADGQLSADLWSRLDGGAQAPVAALYTVTAADASGPYYPDIGEDMVAAAKLPTPGYSRPSEMLAERFHMSEQLLLSLNPGADMTKPGTVLAVAQPQIPALASVDHIEVDKAAASVRAYGPDGALIASLPATVGSTERPSPHGVHKVVGVSFNPVYTYDPSKLTWGPKRRGRFSIRPGPNNPVGLVWIALNAPGYGLHGTPDPNHIGKTASHGCVRLTNWDALWLAHAVRPGVKVTFINKRGGNTNRTADKRT
jgi:lipoprotein-anchoring transpeptidase ErfK/SrfK